MNLPHAALDLDIAGLTADSRKVKPGFLFAALKGSRDDGASYMADAVARGAVAILTAPDTAPAARDLRVAVIAEDNPRRGYALLAARLFGAQPRTIAAVTGTNGKTSTASFTRQLWQRLGHKAVSIGTLGVEGAAMPELAGLTTPDPVALHSGLARLAGAGVDHLVIEASSHGLDQHRIDGVDVAVAAFTNLSHDHLDYHGSKQAYLAAKARLFDGVMAPGGVAVLNADVPEAAHLAEIARRRDHRLVTFGIDHGDGVHRDVRLLQRQIGSHGQHLTIAIGSVRRTVLFSELGDFQVSNLLCALAIVLAGGADAAAALECVPHLSGVRGRVERVARHPNGAPIYVDYAHTPDGLARLLQSLRPYVPGRLHVVFGCGGDRDRAKRPLMGEIAARLADHVVVTDDNPRTEDAASIRREIMAACPGATEIGDRGTAIAAAIAALEAGDLLVIAGKGHEAGQIVGDQVLAFEDAVAARDAVAALSA